MLTIDTRYFAIYWVPGMYYDPNHDDIVRKKLNIRLGFGRHCVTYRRGRGWRKLNMYE